MIRNLYEVLAEADSKPKAKSKEKPKAKPVPREEPILTVKLVDGKKTRDTIAVDFIGGGHELAYPGVIPKGEIWIEQDLAPDEQTDILVHELIEFALMSKGGMTYTPAHNMANKLEKVFRGFEGRWKTKQAPDGDKKVEEGLIAESYSTGLLAFLKYLKAGIDPHDFTHEIESFYEDRGEDPPESFDADEPYNFLDEPEFEEVKADFIKYLETHISPNMADLPTYLFLSGAKLLPRQTWLIHFSDDAGDIAEDGFEFGAEDFTQIGLTTHMADNKRRQGHGWNFALKANDRDVKFASKKYGEEAVMFQSAGVEAYHQGDNEQQVVFWGPNVKERFYLQNDGGDWVVKNPLTDKELVRSGNIFDAIGWVKQNHDQYRKVITNNQKTKPIQPTPKADREKLLAQKPEKIPQPFESETPRRSCPKCKSTNILYGPKDQPDIKWRGSAECGDCGHHGSVVGGGFPLVAEELAETPKGTCPKCGLAKHRSIPHLCPKGEGLVNEAKVPLTNSVPITMPKVWFHGDQSFPKYHTNNVVTRFAYYAGAKPDEIKKPVPDVVEKLYRAGELKNIHHVYPDSEWRIGRTYSGRSNFGFGIYLTGEVDWARRYGDFITVAYIDPALILAGNWSDRDTPGTVMHAVMEKVKSLSGDRMNMGAQARVFYRAIKAVDRTKKALYVQTGAGGGQLAVYDKSIIHSNSVMEFMGKSEIKEDETPKGVCPKCGLAKHRSIPHLCPKGRSKWGAKGGKFTTPERPRFKTKAVTEGEEDLLTVVKNWVSNEHPDDHVPEDYTWARDKVFGTEKLIHMMPGGLAGWKSWLKDECKMVPGQWDKLAKAEKIDDPVILSPGHIWDGWHRIAAAIVNGHKTIPAIVGKLNAR